jgi:phosphoribosylglycinamide formyltransferase-1
MLRLAILASGGGSNLQAIVEAGQAGNLNDVIPVLVVADRSCGALERAELSGIDSVLMDRKKLKERLSAKLSSLLEDRKIDIVALAGWLSILDSGITRKWNGRMINIHPSLLPRHGGPGMFGHHVHEAVLKAGETESGCSVHLVNEGVDEGRVLDQFKVPVLENDTPESLASRVLAGEHKLYPQVISRLAESIKKEKMRSLDNSGL